MFPNNKTLSFPLYLIGIIMIVCGARWLIHPEPWMLDEVANVERLGMTFDTLFAEEINTTLPDYLTQIYRFFGFWVLIIGFFIISLSRDIIKNNIGIQLLSIIGFMMFFGMYLGYTFIPSSHFIQLMWALIFCYIVSLYSYIKLRK
tara:strand:- start:163 stop:600 length:438 start_codon:yes stop_codon:yes gene_type:complete